MDQDCIIIVIGNPGVGKSTLLNCILGEEGTFQSGVSFGEGLTQILQVYEKDGRTYMDTPGLSDISMRQQAAAEIEKALKTGGQFKIFFMVTLESGRIKPDDKTTMQLVLAAAPQIGTSYSVIINKLKPKTLMKLQNNERNRKKLAVHLNQGLPGTFSFHYLVLREELDDEDNKIVSLDSELLGFIETAPTITIAKENVQSIQVDKFEQIKLLMANQLEELKKDNALMQKKIEELDARYQEVKSEMMAQENQLSSMRMELQQSQDEKTSILCCVKKTYHE